MKESKPKEKADATRVEMNSNQNESFTQNVTTASFPENYSDYCKRVQQLATNPTSGLEHSEQRDQLQDPLPLLHPFQRTTSETYKSVAPQYFQLSESVAKTVKDEVRLTHQTLKTPSAIFRKSASTSNELSGLMLNDKSSTYLDCEPHDYFQNQNLLRAERENLTKSGWVFNAESSRPDFSESVLFRERGADHIVQAKNVTKASAVLNNDLDLLLKQEEQKSFGENVGSRCTIEKLEDTLPNSITLPFLASPTNNEHQRKSMILDVLEKKHEKVTRIPPDGNSDNVNSGLVFSQPGFLYLNPRHDVSLETHFDAHKFQLEHVRERKAECGAYNQKTTKENGVAEANSANVKKATFEDVYYRPVQDLNSAQSKYEKFRSARRIPPRNTATQKRSRKNDRQIEIIRRSLGYDEKGNPLPGTFVCPDPYCKKLFGCEQSRSRHVALQHRRKKKEFTCSICQQSYVSKENLHKHSGNCHDPKLPKLTCDQCPAHFSSVFCLQAHKNSTHTQKKPESKECRKVCYVCPICQETALEENNMYRHIRLVHIPSDGNKFLCNECGARKNTKSNLKAHINTVHRKNEFR